MHQHFSSFHWKSSIILERISTLHKTIQISFTFDFYWIIFSLGCSFFCSCTRSVKPLVQSKRSIKSTILNRRCDLISLNWINIRTLSHEKIVIRSGEEVDNLYQQDRKPTTDRYVCKSPSVDSDISIPKKIQLLILWCADSMKISSSDY